MTEAREPADEQAQLDPTGHQRTDHGSTDAAPRRGSVVSKVLTGADRPVALVPLPRVMLEERSA